MPLPLAPLIQGASQLLTTGINAGVQGLQNAKNRKFARENRDLARQWALDDYNMQNEYNSPANQMQRYKAAGLNPHLIYGQSNEGATVRSTGTPDATGIAPKVDLNAAPAINAYNETRMADANYNNAIKQAQVLDEERILKKAQITSTLADAESKGVNTERARFDLGIESELRDTSLEFRKGAVRKQQADTDYTLNQDQRAQTQNAASLKQAVQTLLETQMRTSKMSVEKDHIKKQIQLLDKDLQLKADEIELRKAGLTPSSPTYQKVISKNLERILSHPMLKMRVTGDDPALQPIKHWWKQKGF